ncbi:MFS transporter [Microbulbifer pacificus]|uniref:MFS transporter n=1 Tax=Microbulbifer pacificus TaxID=407164 RepID=A0AAU0MVP0_9GAMM|nr:MFS transporter [Microbulbifer pacificus]WOX04732.1 MFS transporter [Microbulbifer pacificus]
MKTPSTYLPSLLSLLFVAMMGASILTLLPLWVGAFTDLGVFSAQQIGWLAAADVIGIFLSSASAIFWVRRVQWRPMVLIGLTLFLLANLASIGNTNFPALMLNRVLAGIGCGSAYAIALAGLSDQPKPQLAFGLMVTAQVIFGTIGFFAVPRLIQQLQIDAFFHYLNGWLLISILLCILAFPASNREADTRDARQLGTLVNARALTVFFTTVIYYCGVSAVWAYLERIGVNLGLENAAVGDLLGIGFAISGLGSLATPLLSSYLGRIPTLLLAMLVQVATMAVLIGGTTLDAYLLYATTSIVFQFFWSFSLPLLMDQFNRIDQSGRFIVLCASAFKIGEILGPPLAAALIAAGGFAAVLSLGMGCLLLALAMGLAVERWQLPGAGAPVHAEAGAA